MSNRKATLCLPRATIPIYVLGKLRREDGAMVRVIAQDGRRISASPYMGRNLTDNILLVNHEFISVHPGESWDW